MTRHGFPLLSTTLHDLAAHMRQTRLLPSLSPINHLWPLGKNWVSGLKRRNLQGFDTWSKGLEVTVRHG